VPLWARTSPQNNNPPKEPKQQTSKAPVKPHMFVSERQKSKISHQAQKSHISQTFQTTHIKKRPRTRQVRLGTPLQARTSPPKTRLPDILNNESIQ
jgi:hypothetical protein